jgi:acyl carrier protein
MTMHIDILPMIQRLIAENVPSITDPGQIQPNQMLYELGIDSLASVSLMVALAVEADVDLEDFSDDLDQPASVEELCQLAALFRAHKFAALVD